MARNKNIKTTTEITIDDLKNGVHIPSFKAKNIMFRQDSKTALYINHSACLPYSLDLLKLYELVPDAFYAKITTVNDKENKQVYTNAICNVKFDESYYQQKEEHRNTYNTKKDKVITYKHKRGNLIMNAEELRDELYVNAFRLYHKDIKTEKEKHDDYDVFVMYKRSSSKSRVNNCLFIRNDLCQPMLNWSRMGVEFPETLVPQKMWKIDKELFEDIFKNDKFDLASVKAYESLPLSSLVDTIHINPEHILIIDDVQAQVVFRASVTTLDENKLPVVTTIDDYTTSHDIWDGQGLISSDIINDRLDADKSMWLLRERWLKCCAFSTNLQDFFKKRCAEENRDYATATSTNMFDDKILLKDIDLVITPDSLKLLKFSELVPHNYIYDGNLNVEENKKKKQFYLKKNAFDYWIKNVNEFGLVKNEHESKWGEYQQCTYQFLNSLDLNEQEMSEVVKPELDYISRLKNDILVFKNHYNNNYVSNNKSFIVNLLAVNPDAENTALFKNYRRSVINHYIDSLRQGAIKLENCDYQVLFSSPYEMLCAAYGDTITGALIQRNTDIEDGAVEIYSIKYRDGQYICGWRNPHINSGNIAYAKNINHDEYKWFNLSDNIIVIDGWSEFNEITQGSDEDSDTFCASSQKILVEKAKEMVQSGHYPIPINGIKIEKTLRYNDPLESSAIDNIIAKNNIGVICNWAQLCNSYYFELKHKGASQDTLDKIYEKSSLCSSLSQLEIDKSKKYFDSNTVSISKCLRTIFDLQYNGESLIKFVDLPLKKSSISDEEKNMIEELQAKLKSKQITKAEYRKQLDDMLIMVEEDSDDKILIKKPYRPYFFKFLDTGDKQQCADKLNAWDCSMDILERILDALDDKITTHNKPLSQIVTLDEHNLADRKRIDKIFVKVYEFKQAKNKLWKESKDYKENKQQEKALYETLEDDIVKVKVGNADIQHILYLCYVVPDKKTSTFNYVSPEDGSIKKIRYSSLAMYVSGLLWNTHENAFRMCFKSIKESGVQYLQLLKNDETVDIFIDIWGEKYKIVDAL